MNIELTQYPHLIVTSGVLTLDFVMRTAIRNGNPLNLQQAEFKLLATLMLSRKKSLSPDELHQEILENFGSFTDRKSDQRKSIYRAIHSLHQRPSTYDLIDRNKDGYSFACWSPSNHLLKAKLFSKELLLKYRNIRVHPTTWEVERDGKLIHPSVTGFRSLVSLILNPQTKIPTHQMYGIQIGGPVPEHFDPAGAVSATLKRLRQDLGEPNVIDYQSEGRRNAFRSGFILA